MTILSTRTPCSLSCVIITVSSFAAFFMVVPTLLHSTPSFFGLTLTINQYFQSNQTEAAQQQQHVVAGAADRSAPPVAVAPPPDNLDRSTTTWAGSENFGKSPSIPLGDNQTEALSQEESHETMDIEDSSYVSEVSVVPASAPTLSSEELPTPAKNNEKIDDTARKVPVESGSQMVGDDLASFNLTVPVMPLLSPPTNNLTVPVTPLLSPPTNNFEKSTWSKCNLHHGKWVHDPSGPLYKNSTCPNLSQPQNCQGNGRPDNDYENWRWKPNECELPRFDGRKFLELMRGKTLAFVGDSLSRNQMESMICILWQAKAPINHGNRRMHRWYFPSTSTTIVRIWSAWLVHKIAPPASSGPRKGAKVHLDIPDETFMEFLPKFDVLVLASGHWFTPEAIYLLNGTSVSGGPLGRPRRRSRRRQPKQIDTIRSYSMALHTALTAIADLPNYTGLTILRTYSPDHYEGGGWNSGGSCAGLVSPASKPVRNGYVSAMVKVQVAEFERMAKRRVRNGSKLRLMDITELAGYRHDGHAGPYRKRGANVAAPEGGRNGPEDCVHWCMPGPVDTWNEVLFEIIRREFCTGPESCY
ncbi:protein YLS7-like isoform X1 [Iris pallida]|uniref:Protein YLS7-like isoform X1 n=1 Tax=Iris pallida TaxID=29817 RepID=A0AAX6EJL4_IRIPA|nr:protein YLS7-like isoform X1 [Iris pallida]